MGKSIGAGLALGAFMARVEIMDCLPAPAHLFTLGAHALACAAGSAAFDVYQSAEFQASLKEQIETLDTEAAALQQKHPDMVQFVRSAGMSMGIGVCDPRQPDSQPANNDACYKILYRAYEKGLVLISLAGNILRVQPPLVITCEQIKKGFRILSEAMDDFKAGQIPDEVLRYRAGW